MRSSDAYDDAFRAKAEQAALAEEDRAADPALFAQASAKALEEAREREEKLTVARREGDKLRARLLAIQALSLSESAARAAASAASAARAVEAEAKAEAKKLAEIVRLLTGKLGPIGVLEQELSEVYHAAPHASKKAIETFVRAKLLSLQNAEEARFLLAVHRLAETCEAKDEHKVEKDSFEPMLKDLAQTLEQEWSKVYAQCGESIKKDEFTTMTGLANWQRNVVSTYKRLKASSADDQPDALQAYNRALREHNKALQEASKLSINETPFNKSKVHWTGAGLAFVGVGVGLLFVPGGIPFAIICMALGAFCFMVAKFTPPKESKAFSLFKAANTFEYNAETAYQNERVKGQQAAMRS